jgi:Pao retrotransposon peptidase
MAPDTDILRYNLNFCEEHPRTKRGLLSEINSLFDPLGLISPVLIAPRALFQKLCTTFKASWDVLIRVEFSSEWIKIGEKIKKKNEIRINRLARVSERTILFGFSDASQISYGAVLYLWKPNYPDLCW